MSGLFRYSPYHASRTRGDNEVPLLLAQEPWQPLSPALEEGPQPFVQRMDTYALQVVFVHLPHHYKMRGCSAPDIGLAGVRHSAGRMTLLERPKKSQDFPLRLFRGCQQPYLYSRCNPQITTHFAPRLQHNKRVVPWVEIKGKRLLYTPA
jgi:hypothetical protein